MDFIYNKLSTSYNENLVKGTRYWNKLQDSIASFRAEDNAEFLQNQDTKHTDYDSKFAKNYVSKTSRIGNSKNVDIDSSGLGFDGDKVAPEKDIPYHNNTNFEDNSISGIHNYAERDMAREADVNLGGAEDYEKRGLPNSEILWQQYKMAAKAQFWIKKDSKAKELMKGLSAIKRRQVQPPSTLMTVLFSLPDDKTDLEASHTWQAENEEFLALLGTPNCSGVAFLLADHVDELDGKSITEIELLGGKDVNLDVKTG